MRRKTILATSMFVVSACGMAENDSNTIAMALAGPSPRETAAQAGTSYKKLQERAAAEAAKARADELEAITKVSGPLPDLETGCRDVAAALDEYTQKRLRADDFELEHWNAVKEPDLRKIAQTCLDAKSPEIAACEAHALRNASLMRFGLGGEAAIIDHCTKRYGDADGVTPAPTP